MDGQGGKDGAGGGRRQTVHDITVKLKRACRLAGVEKDQLKTDLAELANIDPRTVEQWFHNPSVIRGAGRKAIVQYFGGVKGLPFDNDCFMMSDAKFAQRMDEWENGARSRVPDKILISLAAAVFPLESREMDYICGKYYTYRLSALDTTKIVTEVVAIQPIPGIDYQCKVAMYCNKVDGDPVKEELPVEIFTGDIFKFGSTYMIIVTHSDGLRDKRPRVIQFPTLLTIGRPIHYGIITGFSVHRDDHFSGRIVAHKVSRETVLSQHDKRKVRRIAATDKDVAKYQELLVNDPHQEGEKLLTVDKNKAAKWWGEVRGR
jgi:hypothetical protein